MPKRKTLILILFTVVIAIATLSAARFVKAEVPDGVPVIPLAPTECTTGDGNFKISVVISIVECPGEPPTNKQCTAYCYTVKSLNDLQIDHTLVNGVSADQVLWSTAPASYIPDTLGEPDSKFKTGLFDGHEYQVRFNANSTTYDFCLYIEGISLPTGKSVVVASGRKTIGFCAIAAPGIPFSRSGAGAFAKERCLRVAEVAAGFVYLDAPFADGCKVDQSQVWFLVDSPDCTGTPLNYRNTEPVPKVVYCSGLDRSCPECVAVRVTGEYTCVRFTAQSLTGNQRFQQCIDQDGTACDWEASGCAAVFAE